METKTKQIERILERRIRYGDYQLTGLPPERELSREVGASRMTTRKAIERLIAKGLLRRLENGRLNISPSALNARATIGFLVPSLSSRNVEKWRIGIEKAASELNMRLRAIHYVHWDDPIVLDALKGFDCVLFNPSAEEIPARIIEKMRESRGLVVVLGRDLSAFGFTSICMFPAFFVQQLLDYLAELGHRHIDCFNVQTIDPVIAGRIQQWELWCAAHNIEGTLLNRPIIPYESDPLEQAYEQMGKILDGNKLKGTAILCTTAPAGVGTVRAMKDRGIRLGRDISICTVNDEGFARYLTPSLTCIEMQDPAPYLRVCLQRIVNEKKGKSQWFGPLLMQPQQVLLFKGESAGPVKNQ